MMEVSCYFVYTPQHRLLSKVGSMSGPSCGRQVCPLLGHSMGSWESM